MFSKEAAVDFIQRDWGVKNVEGKLRSDRKRFLGELIIVIHSKVPFQVLTFCEMLLTPPDARVQLSFEMAKKDCMSGHGGNCTMINLFTSWLLDALGFSARLCIATVTSTIVNYHLVILVENIEKNGDLHLVDCGLGLPSFNAIPLNFNEESPVYRDSFLEYKFIRHDDIILRMHGRGDITVKRNNPPVEGLDFIVGKWRRYYRFDVTTSVTEDQLHVYFNVNRIPKNLFPRAVRFPDGRAVVIFNNELLMEKEDGRLEKSTMKSDEEILRCYKEHFPTIRIKTVRQGYLVWRQNTMLAKL